MERALAFQGLLPDEADRLVAVIRRIVPHGQPELQDAMMDTALALDAQMVGNLGFRAEVRKGLADLEERAQTSHRASFVELKPDDQSAILRSIESTPFFQNLVHLTRVDFYNRHIVWQAIRYPGMERWQDREGYLAKDFDKLFW
jgi:hypothetical protein